jgi:tape measure domain-containing protein
MSDLKVKVILEALDRISAPMRKMSSGFVDATTKMRRSMQGLGDAMKSAGGSISAGLSAPIGAFGLLAVRNAGRIEQISISLQGLAGSAERTADLMQRLNKFAAATPFELQGISTAAKMLLGTEKFQIEEIQDVLKATGDVAAGSGVQIEEIAYILAKSASSGIAQAEELNMFLERGIPIYGALAKATGQNEKDIKKMASNGKISYETLYKALTIMSSQGGIYANMMEKQSRSVFGIWSTLSDALTNATASIGNEIVKYFSLGEKMVWLGNKVGEWAERFKNAPGWIKGTVLSVGVFFVILGPLLIVMGQMLTTFATLAIAAKLFGVALGAVTLTSLAVIAGVAALITAGLLLWKNWDAIKNFFVQFWDNLKWVFAQGVEWIMAKIQPMLTMLDSIKNRWSGIFGDSGGLSISSSAPRAVAPQAKIDTGGTLRIKVDSEGRASVVKAAPNNPSSDWDVSTGLLMSGAY